MTQNIIFFDVDGTLVDVRETNEHVPQSTIEAIHRTREKGNLCFLCTGRSLAEIYPHILEIGFDGIIGAGGGFVKIGDEMLYHKRVDDENVKNVVDFFEKNNYDYYLESNGGLFASKNLINRLNHLMYGDVENDPDAKQKMLDNPSHFIDSLIENEDMYRSDVNKICFLENKSIPFENIVSEFSDTFNIIHCTVPKFGYDSGELTVEGVNKAYAIEATIKHLNIPRENTYAFGDGLNDIDMLEYCQYGIAVGNAKEGLKAIADEVTDDISEDGIYNSMLKHNLI